MNLGTSMKKLCRNSTFLSNAAIDVALTICAKLKNLECSMTIHRHLLSQLITDPFIHISVNHLHSENFNLNSKEEKGTRFQTGIGV